MNPILNSDQLNSEIDKIFRDYNFGASSEDKAKAAIQTLINKARVEELKKLTTLESYEDVMGGERRHRAFGYDLENRIAELSTQEENNS